MLGSAQPNRGRLPTLTVTTREFPLTAAATGAN